MKRHTAMFYSTAGLILLALVPVACAQAGEPAASEPLDVVQKWSASTFAAVDRALQNSERAVRAAGEMRHLRDTAPHPAADVRLPEPPTLFGPPGELKQVVLSILQAEGLPPELLAVPLVESGFNPRALSPKGARGLWQLMPATARRFGLNPDGPFDERLDPVRSTSAAARYLKELYATWGDWKLAFAAYNAGEGRVQQAIQQAMSRGAVADFAVLAARGLLPRETRLYVPAVLAAARRLSTKGKVF